MTPLPPANAKGTNHQSAHFKVHSRRGTERFVDGCDSLEEAVTRACRKLQKDPSLRVWITDSTNRLLLAEEEIRLRCGC